MPSSTSKQQRWAGSQLAKKRAGKKTDTDMTESQLSDFAKSRKKKKKG